MSTDTTNAYLRSKVMSASPAELRLMLIEGAIRFARQGREGLVRSDYEASYNGLSQAKAIILELINALRPEVDATLCANLSALYTFMYRRLLDASLQREVAIIDEVISLLEYERETWVMLMEQLVKEQAAEANGQAPAGGQSSPAAAPPAPVHPAFSGGGPARSTLSIEG